MLTCRAWRASKFADDGEAVAEGEDNLRKTGVAGELVVKSTQAEGLLVVVVSGVDDVTIPQSVVRQYPTTCTHEGIDKVEICAVFPLVGIDENEVEYVRFAHVGCGV